MPSMMGASTVDGCGTKSVAANASVNPSAVAEHVSCVETSLTPMRYDGSVAPLIGTKLRYHW